VRARSKWFTVHRWLGIGLGVWFALVGLSGAILVFEDPVDAWLNPHLLTTIQRGSYLSAQTIVELAESAYPLGLVEKIRFPAAQGQVYRLTMRVKPRRVGAQRIEAMFDPVTGTFLGARSLESLGLAAPDCLRTLYEFHRNVLLGGAGSNIVGIAGLLLLTSAITGFVLAVPRTRTALRRSRRVPYDKDDNFSYNTAESIIKEFHAIVGVVALVTMTLSSVGLLVGGVGVILTLHHVRPARSAAGHRCRSRRSRRSR